MLDMLSYCLLVSIVFDKLFIDCIFFYTTFLFWNSYNTCVDKPDAASQVPEPLFIIPQLLKNLCSLD